MPVDASIEWIKVTFGATVPILGYLGYRLSQRGQDTSQREQTAANEFLRMKQLNDGQEVMLARKDAEITRKDAEIDRLARTIEAKDAAIRTEWEPRWARQMDRCRAITDSLAATIATLQTRAPRAKKAAADEVLRDLDQHRNTDHIEMDGPDQ